jgi:hypothetical protein
MPGRLAGLDRPVTRVSAGLRTISTTHVTIAIAALESTGWHIMDA